MISLTGRLPMELAGAMLAFLHRRLQEEVVSLEAFIGIQILVGMIVDQTGETRCAIAIGPQEFWKPICRGLYGLDEGMKNA